MEDKSIGRSKSNVLDLSSNVFEQELGFETGQLEIKLKK